MTAFFGKYFDDHRPRVFVIGINPGRLGTGATGIPFTDPAALKHACKIDHALPERRELSSDMIYRFIDHWGGPHSFYRAFFLTALCPVGFVRNGRNVNYYDSPDLFERLRPFIVDTFHRQLGFGARTNTAIILGSGRNREVLEELNNIHGWFDRLLVLEHPRYVMQYRRRELGAFMEKYEATFADALSEVSTVLGGA